MTYPTNTTGTTLNGILVAVQDLVDSTNNSPYGSNTRGLTLNGVLNAFADLVNARDNSPYTRSTSGTTLDGVLDALTDLVKSQNNSPYTTNTSGTTWNGILAALTDLVTGGNSSPYVRNTSGLSTVDGILDALIDLIANGGIGGGSGHIALSALQDVEGAAQGTAIGTISGGTGPYTVTDATSQTQVSGGTALQVGSVSPTVGTRTITIHDTGTPAAPDANFTITTTPQTPAISLNTASDTGVSNSDSITSDTMPDFDFSLSPADTVVGAVITLYRDGSFLASHTIIQADIDAGSFVLGLSAQSEGTFTYTGQITVSGFASAQSAGVSVTFDTTAPTLTSPTGTATGTTTADISVSTNEATKTLYYVVSTNATPPLDTQVKAGQDSTGATGVAHASPTVSATGVQPFSLTGLTPSTTYYSYFVQVDAAGNTSSVASAASFATTGSSYQGPGDVFGSAYAWYSPARAYSGAFAAGGTRIMKLVDQAGANAIDIHILSTGFVDLAAISAWVTAHSVTTIYVTTLYDQSGNARDLVQATLANMPTLVLNSDPSGTLPTLYNSSSSSSVQMLTAGTFTVAQPITFSAVYIRTSGTAGSGLIGNNAGTVFMGHENGNANRIYVLAGTLAFVTANDAAWHATQGLINGSLSALNVDSTDTTGLAVGAGTFSGNSIRLFRAAPSNVLLGNIAEAGMWAASSTATDRGNLNTNQHSSVYGYNF